MNAYRLEFDLLMNLIRNTDYNNKEYKISKGSTLVGFDNLVALRTALNYSYVLFEAENTDSALTINFKLKSMFVSFDDLENAKNNELYRSLYSISIPIYVKRLIMLLSEFPDKIVKEYIKEVEDEIKEIIIKFLKINFDE